LITFSNVPSTQGFLFHLIVSGYRYLMPFTLEHKPNRVIQYCAAIPAIERLDV
jgi:hypothetical protein